ncbi:hypothetical protein C8A01DRAFT_31099 [Parachaetomium inaequale]|uniref:Uncharacterized protein n=1 Tax=Parachaetomium inaequale TaxID=2588326 RepID=A0AAN6SWG1_9PEZI|nr:hypothetical protein C8A01DRAFT_31099 [Parachaetomium inaequale]
MSNSSPKDTTKDTTSTSTSKYDCPKTSSKIDSAYKTWDRIAEKIATTPSPSKVTMSNSSSKDTTSSSSVSTFSSASTLTNNTDSDKSTSTSTSKYPTWDKVAEKIASRSSESKYSFDSKKDKSGYSAADYKP